MQKNWRTPNNVFGKSTVLKNLQENPDNVSKTDCFKRYFTSIQKETMIFISSIYLKESVNVLAFRRFLLKK
jgi:hypothetical protein